MNDRLQARMAVLDVRSYSAVSFTTSVSLTGAMTSIQRQGALSTVLGQVARHLEWARAGADALAMSALSHPLVSWLSRPLRNRKPSVSTAKRASS